MRQYTGRGRLIPFALKDDEANQWYTFPDHTYLTEPLPATYEKQVIANLNEDPDARVVAVRVGLPKTLLLSQYVSGGVSGVSSILAITVDFWFAVGSVAGLFGVWAIDQGRPSKIPRNDEDAQKVEFPGGVDPQVGNLFFRICDITHECSTAGWEDDLWQAYFAVGRLIEQKRTLKSEQLAEQLYDRIEHAVEQIEEMYEARYEAVQRRLRLGIDPMVPGNEEQRIAAGIEADAEELAMTPFIADLVSEVQAYAELDPGPRDADRD